MISVLVPVYNVEKYLGRCLDSILKQTYTDLEVILVDDDGDDTRISKNPHKLGTASVYIYEHEKITVSNKNEISVGDTVYVHEYQGNVRDVLIVR